MEIEGFPNYLIYPDGRVWSKERKDKSGHKRKGKFICEKTDNLGYKFVSLSNKTKRHNLKIHRLIAIHYIPNPLNKSQVDHINRERGDNRIENLRWVSSGENNLNKIRNKKTNFNWITTDGDKRYLYQRMIKGKKITKSRKDISKLLCYSFFYLLKHPS